MLGMYATYICKNCGKSAILLKEEISSRGYLKCPHCSSKSIILEKETDNFKECMSHSSYKREGRAIRQVRSK
ncbi:MAG: hypothetical protein GX275_05965 [Clostridiales bacterium]|nr:hypothetical protein [Clostridiales bacterium]